MTLVVIVALGALSWSSPSLAVGAAVGVVVLLWAKHPIHRFARDLVSEDDVRDALTFFVAAFVVLPLLPDSDMGPYGVLTRGASGASSCCSPPPGGRAASPAGSSGRDEVWR